MIPYGRQSISDADVAAVVAVLRSDFLTQGPAIPEFERRMSEYCGVAHAVALNSATSALHVACMALGLGPGDTLWTSPNTFVASANCARYCGASVDFVDIDPRTFNMDVAVLAAKLERAQRDGRLPKIVVPVHFGGQSCEMREIWALAQRYGFFVVEDASHAVGADYAGAKVGACAYSHAAVFSFHPVKIITTGEGGMVLTRAPALAARMSQLRTHGITRETARMRDSAQGGWYYEQHELGYNYRITDLQAALGSSQMARLDPFVAQRRRLAARYDELLRGLPVTLPGRSESGESSWHLYVVRVPERRRVFDELRAAGIGVNVHYIPVHLQPYYRELGFAPGQFPEAERYYAECLSLPLFPGLNDALQDRVVAALKQALP